MPACTSFWTIGARRARRERTRPVLLKLGTIGFGGPAALVGYMRRDLVEDRRLVDESTFNLSIALAQIMPGPLAAQTAMAIGYFQGGVIGATLVGLAFILPSFVMVLGLGAFYVAFGGMSWMQAMFYGIAPAVIAIITIAAHRLARGTNKRDPLLWTVFGVMFIVTAWMGTELGPLFIMAGLVVAAEPRLARAIAAQRFWQRPASPARSLSLAWSTRSTAHTMRPVRSLCSSRFSCSSPKQVRSFSEAAWQSCRFCNRESSTTLAGSPNINSSMRWRWR